MNLSNVLSFEGRYSRQPWWIATVVLWVLQWLITMAAGAMGVAGLNPMSPATADTPMTAAALPFVVVSLALLWPTFAIYAKRWHDRGKSGWWSLILLIPLVGWVWALIELGFLRGDDGPNAYGPAP